MKKTLLILGIIIAAVGVVALLYGAFNRFVFYNTLDGSNSFYDGIKLRMKISFIIGSILEIIGAICFIIRIWL